MESMELLFAHCKFSLVVWFITFSWLGCVIISPRSVVLLYVCVCVRQSYRSQSIIMRNHYPSKIFLTHENSLPNDHKGSQLHSHPTTLPNSLLTNSEFLILSILYTEKASNLRNKF